MDFFHVLNRGVDKRKVFMSSADYARFMHDLWEFNDLAPADHHGGDHIHQQRNMGDVRRLPLLELEERDKLVRIHFFCLMPNHYHLLLSPIDDDMENLSLFMKKLNGGYAKYFNEKYGRSGALWQGKYKSVPIERDAHFLYIPFYIHFNALDLKYPEWRVQCPASPKKAEEFLKTYRWSSHLDYLGEENFPSVTDRSFFLKHFGGEKGYTREFKKMLGSFNANKITGIALE